MAPFLEPMKFFNQLLMTAKPHSLKLLALAKAHGLQLWALSKDHSQTLRGFVARHPKHVTAAVAAVLLACQLVMHPLWTLGGQAIASTVAGTRAEPYLMWSLAALNVASVLFVLFAGGS